MLPLKGGEGYVANYFDFTVTVLDAVTLDTLATIDLGPDLGAPNAVVFSPDHRYAFVSMDDSDKIVVIDTTTREVVNIIEGSPATLEALIFLRPRGDRIYVPTRGFPYITVIDVRTQAIIGQIDLPDGGLYAMAFSPNGQLAYAGNFNSDCSPAGISRLDLKNNTFLDTIDTDGRDIVDVAASPKGTVLLATSNDRILVVDLMTNDVVGFVMGSPGNADCGAVDECEYNEVAGIAFNATGTRAYAVDPGNHLITIDTTDPLHPKELSRIDVVSDIDVWELDIFGDRAYVITQDRDFVGRPSEVFAYDISLDPPLLVADGMAGSFASQLDSWGGKAKIAKHAKPVKEDAHGAGQIPGKVNFEFHAKNTHKGLNGKCHVADHSIKPKRTIKCLNVTGLEFGGDADGHPTAMITGDAIDSDSGDTTYTIHATDGGKAGKGNDSFAIDTPSGFHRAGTLKSGNVTVKP